MALELNLKKSDNESWGFRLTGGVEYDVPFTVVYVTENSIAEKGGLGSNDIIVRINNIATTGLTHAEVHDLLISSGNNLILAVRRDLSDLSSPTTYDEESNEEISNIMQASLENEELFDHERHVHFEIVNTTDEINALGDTRVVTLAPKENKTQAVVSVDAQNVISEENERKWSTFLQRPKNPKPVVKKTDDVPKGEPYRVIIKKQKKKSLQDVKIAHSEESSVKEEILEKNRESEDATPKVNIPEIEEEIAIRAEIRDEEDIIEEEAEEGCEEDKSREENNVTGRESLSGDINNAPDERNVALEKLLEEKLADVQKQLEVLAMLPSAIRSTIEAVTKQIASIVNNTGSVPENEEQEILEENSEVGTDEAEQEITEEGSLPTIDEEENIEKERQHTDEEFDEEHIQNGHIENEYTETEFDAENKNEETIPEDRAPEENLTEEEKEALRAEQELLDKQQKVNHWNEIWPWSDKKKTIYSINFLKYQPPPKNLDYLQRSDVYKLVHDLEPPVRGISSRVSKILSEQDYYQAG